MQAKKIAGMFFVAAALGTRIVSLASAATAKQPITVNGDVVEFKSEGKEVIAEGNVEITYQDNVMTCDRVRVFLDEKLAVAEGNVELIRPEKEELQGEMIIFDFGDQTGSIINPSVRMMPYYGKSNSMEKISEGEFALTEGEISTCDLPHPHYWLRCREVNVSPDRVMTAKGVTLGAFGVPIMKMPRYSQDLNDKYPRLMVTPGYDKKLGTELFGAYRYYLNPNARGRLHFDWYGNIGFGYGADLNYNTKTIGAGNLKYYRIDESNAIDERIPDYNERFRVELRHKWDMTERDHIVMEFYKHSDAEFRKDYFFREYEKDTNPKSFFLFSHVYPSATLSLLSSPRVNKFDGMVEKIPELRLETVSQKIADTSFYFKSTSSLSQLTNAPADAASSAAVGRMDTSNELAYVFRFMDLDFKPMAGHRDTFYSRGLNSKSDLMRGLFFTGLDVSTKLFRVFDVETDRMNLDIHGLRHVVTPSLQYRYQHEPTVSKEKLQQLDDVDALDKLNKVTLGLDQRFQTKRDGVSVDLMTLLLSSDFYFERNSTYGKGFENFKYDLEFKPYPWWEFDSDGEYDTSGDYFRTLNADFWANMGKARTGLGYRFKKDESSQVTAGFTSPLNPLWKLGVYERFEFKTGDLVEQEYTLERDLHCWIVRLIVNNRVDEGISVLLEFTLKAFPELGFNAEANFRPPRSE
ncbi:MAG: hypothetical protein V1863_05625 [Candidatus Omnitrophota bacterium]